MAKAEKLNLGKTMANGNSEELIELVKSIRDTLVKEISEVREAAKKEVATIDERAKRAEKAANDTRVWAMWTNGPVALIGVIVSLVAVLLTVYLATGATQDFRTFEDKSSSLKVLYATDTVYFDKEDFSIANHPRIGRFFSAKLDLNEQMPTVDLKYDPRITIRLSSSMDYRAGELPSLSENHRQFVIARYKESDNPFAEPEPSWGPPIGWWVVCQINDPELPPGLRRATTRVDVFLPLGLALD